MLGAEAGAAGSFGATVKLFCFVRLKRTPDPSTEPEGEGCEDVQPSEAEAAAAARCATSFFAASTATCWRLRDSPPVLEAAAGFG